MAKGKGKPKIGKTPIVGGKKDGARPSAKKQTTALLPANKVSGASKRIAKMEKADVAC